MSAPTHNVYNYYYTCITIYQICTCIYQYCYRLRIIMSNRHVEVVITAEHLVHGADSDIIRHIADMLTLCVQFGVVPDNFTNGTLVPIPKKPGCDTSI